MRRRLHFLLVAAAIILIPLIIAVWWWFYWPTFHRNRLLADARRLLDAGQPARAEEALLPLIKEQPDDLRVQFLYAQALRRSGRNREASIALQRSVQLGLPESEGLREYALVQAAGDFKLAEGALQKVLQAEPNDAEAAEALARGYARSQRWLEAERSFTHLLDREPERQEFRLGRAKVRLELGRYDPAAADLRKLLEVAPKHFEARLLLAHCLLSNAHVAEAEKELLLCRKLQPAHAGPLIGLANCALEQGELDRAQKLIQEAVTLAPLDPLALHVQGTLFLRRQRYDLAIPVYERLLTRNPRDKEAHLKLAQALSQTGALARAQEHQDKFQQLDRAEAERERLRHVGIFKDP